MTVHRLTARRVTWTIVLGFVFAALPVPSAGAPQPGSPECVALADFLVEIEAGGHRAVIGTEIDDDPERPPTREDFLAAAELMRTYLAELQGIDPPPFAQTYHALLVQGADQMSQMLDAMALVGFVAILGFEETIDDLAAEVAQEALFLERSCNLAVVDHDRDGTDEIGEGISIIEVSAQSTGSRGAPFPIGSTVRYQDTWEVTVIEVSPDGTDAILARTEINNPPVDGQQYVIVTLRVTNLGPETDSFRIEELRTTGTSTIAYTQLDDDCGLVPEALKARDVLPGESAVGNVCWSIRVEDLDALVLYSSGSAPADRVYLALVDPPSGSPVAGTPIGSTSWSARR